MLKPTGKIREKLFAAKLVFKSIGVSYSNAPGEEGDLLSDIAGSAY